MSLRVWYPGPRDDEVFHQLGRELEGTAELFKDRPTCCDVLIDGRATESMLEVVRERGAVIVPFAGVPPATIETLRTRPDLTLHNLHHNGPETAETTIALLLAAAKRIHTADRAMRTGDWAPRYMPEEMIRLDGKTALILGMGSIGRRTAIACAAMGMKVFGVRRGAEAKENQTIGVGETSTAVEVFPMAAWRELLPESNFLVLCIPLTPETQNLIGREDLEALKKPSFVINAARGQIVKEKDLYEALRDNALHAAGLDVWYRYPKHPEGIVPGFFDMPDEARHTFPSEFPFHELDNVVMSPHRGGSSLEAEEARIEHLVMLIRALFEHGEMPNRVELDAGY